MWQPNFNSGQYIGGQAWTKTQAGEVSNESVTFLVVGILVVLFVSGGERIIMNMSLLPDPYHSAVTVRPITKTNQREGISHIPSRGLVVLRLLPCMTLQGLLECLVSGNLTFQNTARGAGLVSPNSFRWQLFTLSPTPMALVNPGTGGHSQRMEAGPSSPGFPSPETTGFSSTTISEQGLRNSVLQI